MIIVIINECLEVSYLDLLEPSFAFNQWIKLYHWMIGRFSMILKKFLNNFIALQFIRRDAKNLKSLLFSNKAALYSESLFSNLLSAFVAKLFHLALHTLLLKVFEHFLHSFTNGQGTNPFPFGMSGCVFSCIIMHRQSFFDLIRGLFY